ncbi:MAG: hypothetical protein EOO10_04260 [Chitinophagaceae bacterium]|nr:MAG: hypothetical protein EOO10_04260 [Chitinophagaceae bacterium]
MSDRIQALAQQITGKKSIDDCSIDELQHMAKRHPYYAPIQFLLLQKLRQSGTPEQAEAQYRKAVLFYHDPLLFEYFISSNNFYVEEMATANDSQLINPDTIDEYRQEEQAILQESSESIPDIIGNPLEESIGVNNDYPLLENAGNELDVPQPEESIAKEEANEIEASKEPEFSGSAISEEVVETAGEEPEQNPVTQEDPSNETKVLPAVELNEIKPTASELAFEPFHTVDYFASQGIKIMADEAPKDKLGKQLKSFTEWLKTMKRLPASQITATAETSAEKKVETLANHSVSESDVVTEAMAEVWLKQGNTDKALDIYNKLSLLNPSKKAYFAAKIENLKLS